VRQAAAEEERKMSIGIRRAQAVIVAIALAIAALAYANAQGSVAGETAPTEGAAPQRSNQASDVEAAIARTNAAGKLRAALGSDFGGVWFDSSTAKLHVGVTSQLSRRNAEAVAMQLGLSEHLVEIPVQSTYAELEATQDRLNHRLADLFEGGQVQTWLMPDRNAVGVELGSSVPPSRRADLESAAAAEQVDVSINVLPGPRLDRIQAGRCGKFVPGAANCNPTIVGGVTIERANKGCSAGPAVLLKNRANKAAATATFLLTAGHCIAGAGGNGLPWYAYEKGSTTKKEIGPAITHINGPTDEGLIEVNDPGDWAKDKDAIPVIPAVAAWDGSKETDPTIVTSQTEQMMDGKSCLQGQRSGKRCGKITKVNVTDTFSGVTLEKLIQVDLGSTKAGGGDSGAPFAVEADPGAIEGIMVAYNDEGGGEGKLVYYQPLKVVFDRLENERMMSVELLKKDNEYRHPKVKAGAYPATIHGSTAASQKFVTEAGSIECKSSSFHAVLSEGEIETSTLTLTPEYKECKASFLGAAATVEMEGCSYLLHVVEKTSSDNYRAYTDVTCPAGQSIKITAFTCKAEIKAQTERETVDLIDDTGGGPKKDITMRPTLGGISYTVTQDGLFCPFNGTGERTNGEYTSAENITLTGQNPSEPGQKIDIEVAGP
jgi:hypothetical protein